MVRTFAPLSAGIARYGYKSFTLWNISGALAWAASVTLLGTWLGHFEVIAKNIDVIAVLMVLVSVLPWVVEFVKRRRRNRGPAAETRPGPGSQETDRPPAQRISQDNS
ncbi:DedA family protein [Arthrobacter sp. H16F315]|uniref:DedA family protein n=1 Tax=Arthrobacter sp. H16F315 TaxID=2955314 RepID=UPI0031590215